MSGDQQTTDSHASSRVTIPRLRNLPVTAKLFVALFTLLMVGVTFWAAFLYTVDRGLVDPENASRQQGIKFNADPGDTLAPQYDSLYGADDSLYASDDEAIDMQPAADESPLRKNLGLAHTHINGQTLLFFAIGLIFLGTTLSERRKQQVLVLFAVAVLMHTIGLTGRGFYWFFDDLLSFSGVIILAAILFMAGMIVMDLAKKPEES